VVGPAHKALTMNAAGSSSCTLAASHKGADGFADKGSHGQGGLSALPTVTITVLSVSAAGCR
jgi:hypothetical protein